MASPRISAATDAHSDRISCLDRSLSRLSDTAAPSLRTLADAASRRTNIFEQAAIAAANHHVDDTADAAAPPPRPSLQEITDAYAPVTLESQFQDLYRTLHPALVATTAARRSNASAFVQGTRGSGKTLLVHRVLQALADEICSVNDAGNNRNRMFRLVYVNGITVPGHSVHTVVREILQQLSDAAAAFGDDHKTKDKDSDRTEQFLRLKQTSFTNQLQLLNEILQIACVDGLPVVFVLDELDAFVPSSSSSNQRRHNNESTASTTTSTVSTQANVGWTQKQPDRQLLLYHLLERVATQGSSCSLVGLTSDSAILARLEKRIKSRAEGTAQFVWTGRQPASSTKESYEEGLAKILSGSIAVEEEKGDGDTSQAQLLRREVTDILLGKNTINNAACTTVSEDPTENSIAQQQRQRIHEAFEFEHRLGRDVRWFRRVLYHALALYRHDLVMTQQQEKQSRENNMDQQTTAPVAPLHPRYFEEALMDLGGSVGPAPTSKPTESSSSSTAVVESDLRLQALRDLSGPQVALVLAARRILHRDTGKTGAHHQQDAAPEAQLNLFRMLHEYRAFYKSSRYTEAVLRRAFADLLETGLFRPALDHTGSGPFQYQFRDYETLFSYTNTDTVERMPLHLVLDIHREVKRAIDDNALNCSTALREWGRHTN